MEIYVDSSLQALGITDVVIGIARNVDPNAKLSESFLEKMHQAEKWAIDAEMNHVIDHPYTQGYVQLLETVGRSVKKNPPTIPAFVNNIKRREAMPRVNSIVDIYNVESLHSFLAIGGHDLDKITFPLTFTIAKQEDEFTPILSNPKHVAATDFLYRDSKGIIAWLGIKDSEFYKFDENTKNAIFIIQGNANTDVDVRIKALERIRDDLYTCMPNLEFEIQVIHISDKPE